MRRPLGTINRNGGGRRVGHALIVEVMDHASAALTWRERWVLGVLAETADDESRECNPGYDGESEASALFKARVRCSRSQYFETMKALVEKRAIEPLRRGQRQGAAKFRILPMAPVQSPGLRDAENPRSQSPDLQDVQRPGLQDTDRAQGPEPQDAESAAQHPGLRDTGVRFDPISVSRFAGPLVGGSSSPENSSSSSPRECARAAGVSQEEEEEFIRWVIKRHDPKSGEWWRKLAGNGDLAILAEAWRTTRRGPNRPVAEILTEHDSAPANTVPAIAVRAKYEPGDDKQLRERARQDFAEIPRTLWEPLLAEARRLLLAADYEPTWNASRVVAAQLLAHRGEPIAALHLPLEPDEAHRTAKFALDHLPAADRDAAYTEAAAELHAVGLTDERAYVIHAGEILTRWQYAPPPPKEAEP